MASAGWDGDLPDGASRIDAPTRVFSIVGRIAVDGQEELPDVAALQEQFTLRPLGDGSELAGIPRPDASLPEHLRFFDAMRLWSQAFPPPAAERDHLERFEPMGVLAEDGVCSQVDVSLSAGLGEGLAAGKPRIDELAQAPPRVHAAAAATRRKR